MSHHSITFSSKFFFDISAINGPHENIFISILKRINFLKYKKPEKDLSNLNRSEVFRIIHNIEKDPKHGIQVRPPKVLAEEDVRSVS